MKLFSLENLPKNITFTPYLLASLAKRYFQLQKNQPKYQSRLLLSWVKQCRNTAFGQEYNFDKIASIDAFQRSVPVMHFDTMEPWIIRAMHGESKVITPGIIERFATSSGTTGASKHLPVTKRSLHANHFKAGTAGLMHYIKENPTTTMFSGQNITIGGSFGINPYTGKKNVGFISAILQKFSPPWAKAMKHPKSRIAYLTDREPKVAKLIASTTKKNITSIAWQPSWSTQFLTKVLETTGKKTITEVWPHMQLVMRGWMAIDLYRDTFKRLFGDNQTIKYYQIYNASEWFFAMQHENDRDDMLLFLNHWVFYEFIPLAAYMVWDYSVSHTVEDVVAWEQYVILITTLAGLRRYVLGDVIVFTGTTPHTIKIIWRTKYHLDVAGECTPWHILEKVLFDAAHQHGLSIKEYTVWPHIYDDGSGAYEWIIGIWRDETIMNNNQPAANDIIIEKFSNTLDEILCTSWSLYDDERHDTHMLKKPIAHIVSDTLFFQRLEKKEKLWWQHKVPKVSNNPSIIQEMLELM